MDARSYYKAERQKYLEKIKKTILPTLSEERLPLLDRVKNIEGEVVLLFVGINQDSKFDAQEASELADFVMQESLNLVQKIAQDIDERIRRDTNQWGVFGQAIGHAEKELEALKLSGLSPDAMEADKLKLQKILEKYTRSRSSLELELSKLQEQASSLKMAIDELRGRLLSHKQKYNTLNLQVPIKEKKSETELTEEQKVEQEKQKQSLGKVVRIIGNIYSDQRDQKSSDPGFFKNIKTFAVKHKIVSSDHLGDVNALKKKMLSAFEEKEDPKKVFIYMLNLLNRYLKNKDLDLGKLIEKINSKPDDHHYIRSLVLGIYRLMVEQPKFAEDAYNQFAKHVKESDEQLAVPEEFNECLKKRGNLKPDLFTKWQEEGVKIDFDDALTRYHKCLRSGDDDENQRMKQKCLKDVTMKIRLNKAEVLKSVYETWRAQASKSGEVFASIFPGKFEEFVSKVAPRESQVEAAAPTPEAGASSSVPGLRKGSRGE